MTPTLSILIPTLDNDERRKLLSLLSGRLAPQLTPRVKVVTLSDKGQQTTGAKRQQLIEQAETPFVVFVDDDDLVSEDYCTRVLAAIDAGADVVGFRMRCYQDGELTGYAIHTLKCQSWFTEKRSDGLTDFWRTPNHLNPIRREIALSVGYANRTLGEDADYSKRLYAMHGETMREVMVDEYLYEYWCRIPPKRPVVLFDDDGRLTYEGAEAAIKAGGSAWWQGRQCTKLEQLSE